MMLKYKDYIGHVEFDADAGIFHGEVLDTRDVITFQGTSVAELEQAFRDSIDDYLQFCLQRGEKPDKPSLSQFTMGYGNYTEERDQILGSLTVDEIVAEIKRNRDNSAS